MAINIELFLAGHPFLFLQREGRVKGFDRGGIVTAVGGGGRDVHPLFAVKCTRYKLRHKQGGREVTVHDKADVLLFAAYKSTAHVVARIAEVDVHIVASLGL